MIRPIFRAALAALAFLVASPAAAPATAKPLRAAVVLAQHHDTDALAHKRAVMSAGASMSGVQLAREDRLIRALKSGASWTVLDRYWLFAGENSTQALIDLKARASATAVNSPTFTPSQGFAGNGTSSYVNPNYVPSTNAVQFTLNSGSMGVYDRTNRTTGANTVEAGTNAGGNKTEFWLKYVDNLTYGNMSNGGDSTFGTPATVQGMWVLSRTAANLKTLYLNSASVGTSADASSGLSTGAPFALARNNSGSPTNFSTDQLAVLFFSAGLVAAQVTTVSSATNAYMTSLGTNVYP